jgi:hypothetical protein
MTQIQLDDQQRQALAALLSALTAPTKPEPKPEPQPETAAQGASAPPPAGPAHAGNFSDANERELQRLRDQTLSPRRFAEALIVERSAPEPAPEPSAAFRAEARPRPAADWHQTRGWRRLLYVLPLALISLPLAYIVFAGAPAGAGDYKHVIYAWSLLKILTFGIAAAALDWCLSPRDQPEDLDGIAQGAAWKRRAVIVAAGVIAGAVSP